MAIGIWSRLSGMTVGVLLHLASTGLAQPHVALPPVNLGGTSFMDGPGGPGLGAQATFTRFDASRFTDGSGASLPGQYGLTALAEVTYFGYTSSAKILGGYWGAEVVIPVVHLSITTPNGDSRAAGLGDVTFSPLVFQLADTTLLGCRISHRVDVDVVAPVGKYSATSSVNVGNNLWSVNPYYAITVQITERIETSWRLHYLWNSPNRDPGSDYDASSIQPGQAVHFNGAVSVAVNASLRVGAAGYFLTQVSDERVAGQPVAGSRERVAGIGPGLHFATKTLRVLANVYAELAAENRPTGSRFFLSILKTW